jgi:uroporphyrinogen-III synthase
MRVVLTRPANDAKVWAQGLTAAGHEVVLLPLIEIGAAPDPEQVAQYWRRLSQFQAVMFVSANAVTGFFAGRSAEPSREKPTGQVWGKTLLRAWATGPGTVQALLSQGVPADSIDSPEPSAAQFDSEALWEKVGNQLPPGVKVLIVRGTNDRLGEGHANGSNGSDGLGRDWLAGRLASAGVAVEFCVAYQRKKPVFAAGQLQAIQKRVNSDTADPLIWLFSSSEAISNLTDAFPGQLWSRSTALCTHPRIAQRARACGFGVVRESRPTLADVVASIESTA